MKAKKRIRDVVYHVIVFGIGILMIYPLIWMFMSSFKETKTIFQTAGSLIPNPDVYKRQAPVCQAARSQS